MTVPLLSLADTLPPLALLSLPCDSKVLTQLASPEEQNAGTLLQS